MIKRNLITSAKLEDSRYITQPKNTVKVKYIEDENYQPPSAEDRFVFKKG